jgi:hypothetical protein
MNSASVSTVLLEQPMAPLLLSTVRPFKTKRLTCLVLIGHIKRNLFTVDVHNLLRNATSNFLDNIEVQPPLGEVLLCTVQHTTKTLLCPHGGLIGTALTAHGTIILEKERLIKSDSVYRIITKRLTIQQNRLFGYFVDILQNLNRTLYRHFTPPL